MQGSLGTGEVLNDQTPLAIVQTSLAVKLPSVDAATIGQGLRSRDISRTIGNDLACVGEGLHHVDIASGKHHGATGDVWTALPS